MTGHRLPPSPSPGWHNPERWLLFVELATFVFVLAGAIAAWATLQALNDAYRDLQQTDARLLMQLTAPADPVATDPPALSSAPARSLPPQLPFLGGLLADPLPTPRPIATPFRQQTPWRESGYVLNPSEPAAMTPARRIQIPRIGVDSAILPGTDPRALKLGVAQFGALIGPGEPGNLVLAAHDDSYGEIFRDLGDLRPGDPITLTAGDRSYTYRVRDTLIVEPHEVWVMLPTSKPTLTLITCYPHLINSHRLVVFAELPK